MILRGFNSNLRRVDGRIDWEKEKAKTCPHCGGITAFAHWKMKDPDESGWQHFCKNCGGLGWLPDIIPFPKGKGV